MLPAVAEMAPTPTAINASLQTEGNARVEIVLGNGRVLRVPAGVAAEAVARLAQALDPL
jgi:hypothetical protein